MSGPLPSRSLDELLVHASWLNRLARHLVRDADFAADLTQEVWLAAHRSPPDRARPARPWLSEVLRNAIRMRLRRDARQARSEEAALPPAALPSSEAVHEQLELQRHLVDAVMTLDEPLRVVVLLRFFEEKSSSEIAHALGVPAGTVRWRLKLAVDRLRSELDRRCPGGRRQWVLAATGGSLGWPHTFGKGALAMAKLKTAGAGAALLLALLVGTGLWSMVGAYKSPANAPARDPRAAAATTFHSGWSLPEPDEGQPGTITGRVRDPAGNPVADATIILVRATSDSLAGGKITPTADVRSAASGTFAFTTVPAGRYTAVAMARGWAPGRAEVLVADHGDATVDMVLAAGGAVLSGQVFDAGGGPIAHASITAVLTRPGPRPGPQTFVLRAATDGQGRYAIYARSGHHNLRVEAAGYAPIESWVYLLEGPRTRDFELAPTAQITGRVLERNSREPVAGAEVMLASSEERGPRVEIPTVRTDQDGHFVFAAVNAGGYIASARKGSLVAAAHELVVATADKAELELVVDAGRSVSGRVLDHEGRPVPGAAVQVSRTAFVGQEPPIKTVSASDGRYLVEGLLPGVLRLRAKVDAFPSMNHQAVTVAGTDLDNVDLRVDRPATIEGRVLTADEKPAVDVTLTANTADRRPDRSMMTRVDAATDQEGRFRIIVPPAEVKLSAADSSGVSRAFADLGTLVAGEVRDVLLRLAPAGNARISGVVADPGGRAIGDVGITVNGDRFSRFARTDAAGHFVVDQLDAGKYLVIAQTEEDTGWIGPWNSSELVVKLADGEQRSDLALILPTATQITGRVVDNDGQPVPGATVLASPEQYGRIVGGTPKRAFADEDGRFVVKAVPRLPHTLTALHQQHPKAIASGVQGGQNDVVLRFPRASELSGAAHDHHGRPITDYLLRVKSEAGSFTRQIHDPAGRFRIPRAVAGNHSLTALTATGQHGTTTVTLAEGEVQANIELVLTAGVDLAVRVVDGESGAAISGAAVRAATEMSERTKTTDPEGRVVFRELPPGGKANLFVSAPNYGPMHPRVDVPNGPGSGETVVKLPRSLPAK
jgi:RNA polymerase sigma factor (sigma-70 family)